MSLIQGTGGGLGGAGAPGGALGSFYSHAINQSLRFNDDDSAYLRKQNFSGSPTSDQTCTFSVWVKLTHDGSRNAIYGSSTGSNAFTSLSFNSDGNVDLRARNSSSTDIIDVISNSVFRDPSAWYHVMSVYDMTNSTRADRAQIYINSVRITDLSDDTLPNNTTTDFYNGDFISDMQIGRTNTNSSNNLYADFYLAEYHRVDGQALTPSSFGETKEGVWIPKRYSGSYGNHGFYLNFADTSDIGKDVSGNGNDFTPNNLAATDVVLDSPTNNFPTMNVLNKASSSVTLSNGNLTAAMNSTSGSGYVIAPSTMALPSTGKWYWEGDFSGANTGGSLVSMAGVADSSLPIIGKTANFINSAGDYIVWYGHNNSIRNSGLGNTNTFTSHITTQASGTVSFAVDMDNRWVFVAVNGTYINGTPNFSNGTNKVYDLTAGVEYVPFFAHNGGSGGGFVVNFGQGGKTFSSAQQPDDGIGTFEYDVPADYKALCTSNLPDLTIGPEQDSQADDYFKTLLWTGNGTDGRSITGVGFDPDWVWIKCRDLTTNNLINDTVRGANKTMFPEDVTNGETADNGGGFLSAFVTDGFSVTSGSSGDDAVNDTSDKYVAWNWLAGTSFSNSSGSNGATVDSSGQYNRKAGFSIVTFNSGSTANYKAYHGLNAEPDFIIARSRPAGFSWIVYERSTASTVNKYLIWNHINQQTDNGTSIWGDALSDTNTNTFGFRSGNAFTNNSDCIAYVFANIEGYSKAGQYIGNGANDGMFVYTGFRPAWTMIKRAIGGTDHWVIDDSARSPFNEMNNTLYANKTDDEYTSGLFGIDFLSNGFKIRDNDGNYNNGSSTYIYLAFAETPFKFANAR